MVLLFGVGSVGLKTTLLFPTIVLGDGDLLLGLLSKGLGGGQNLSLGALGCTMLGNKGWGTAGSV